MRNSVRERMRNGIAQGRQTKIESCVRERINKTDFKSEKSKYCCKSPSQNAGVIKAESPHVLAFPLRSPLNI